NVLDSVLVYAIKHSSAYAKSALSVNTLTRPFARIANHFIHRYGAVLSYRFLYYVQFSQYPACSISLDDAFFVGKISEQVRYLAPHSSDFADCIRLLFFIKCAIISLHLFEYAVKVGFLRHNFRHYNCPLSPVGGVVLGRSSRVITRKLLPRNLPRSRSYSACNSRANFRYFSATIDLSTDSSPSVHLKSRAAPHALCHAPCTCSYNTR